MDSLENCDNQEDEQFFEYIDQAELGAEENVITEADLGNDDRKTIKIHNKQYTKILDVYVKNIEENLKQKRIYKIIFFTVTMIILAIVGILLIVKVITLEKESVEATKELIGISITFISTIIAIPKIIAQYLFDSHEEDNAVKIIENIQNYDKNVRNKINDIE